MRNNKNEVRSADVGNATALAKGKSASRADTARVRRGLKEKGRRKAPRIPRGGCESIRDDAIGDLPRRQAVTSEYAQPFALGVAQLCPRCRLANAPAVLVDLHFLGATLVRSYRSLLAGCGGQAVPSVRAPTPLSTCS